MSGDLDQISAAIGRLEARADSQERDRGEMRRDLADVLNSLRDLNIKLAPVIETVGVIKPKVDKLDEQRIKIAVIGSIAMLILGAVGSLTVDLMRHWFMK